MSDGMISKIQRCCVNDGPGIRTVVFLKGCPLRCKWCHNPESWKREPQLFFSPDKCLNCKGCATACQFGGHVWENGKHELRRDVCVRCFCCADVCSGALSVIGEKRTVEAVLAEALEDMPFYEASGGGVTLSGGEPMAQFAFTSALLQALKQNGVHTCIETSGYAPEEELRRAAQWVDLFYYDLKHTDPKAHETWVGVPLAPILSNLQMLNDTGAQVVLRCPVIPGVHDEVHLRRIAELANSLTCIREIHIMPYHIYGASKYGSVGMNYELADVDAPTEKTVEYWIACVQAQTPIHVCRG